MGYFGIPFRNGVPIGLGSIVGFGAPQEFSPSELFLGGTAGAWYDPSDLTTLFTTSAGTTQCAMPGQGSAVSVGAMLDKRATGYSVFFDGTGDYLTAGTTSTFNFMHNASALFTFECWVYRTVANVLQILFTTNGTATANTGCSVYITSGNRVEFVISRGVSGTLVCFATGVATVPANQWSHIALTYDQSLTSDNVKFYINGALDAQNTKTANAPSGGNSTTAGIIGATSTGAFPISGYISNLRIVNAVLPISMPTAPLSPISGTSLLTCGTTWSGNPAITKNGDVRIDGLNPFTASPVGNHAIAFNDTTARPELRARVNLLVATATLSTQNVTTQATSYTLSFAGTGSITLSGTATGSYSAGTHTITCTAGTLTLTVSGTVTTADLRPANSGTLLPAYQAVVDANTYDTSGFPLYLRFDGIDDSMYTPANLNLSGTDKVAVFAGVRKLSDASIGVAMETSINSGNNDGALMLTTSGQVTPGAKYGSTLRGTALIYAETATAYAAPRSDVLALINDIAQSTAATEQIMRINGAQVALTFVGADAGTGNLGNHRLFIGSRNNSGAFLNGHLHSLIIAGSAVSAGNISAAEQWVAQRTGIVIP